MTLGASDAGLLLLKLSFCTVHALKHSPLLSLLVVAVEVLLLLLALLVLVVVLGVLQEWLFVPPSLPSIAASCSRTQEMLGRLNACGVCMQIRSEHELFDAVSEG